MVRYMLGSAIEMYQGREEVSIEKRRHAGFVWRVNAWVEERFARFRERYAAVLALALDHKVVTLSAAGLFIAASLLLIPAIGEDFFPTVDAGQFRLHIRAPAGTRLEQTELIFGSSLHKRGKTWRTRARPCNSPRSTSSVGRGYTTTAQ